MSSKPLLLLTDPAHFEVSYTINPWMQPCAWAKNPAGHLAAARRSFQSFAATLIAAGARLEIMPGVAGLPDMVFPANAAIVLDRLALLSRFRHSERRAEEQHFQAYFRALTERGFILDEIAQLPPNCFQEGAGDCIWDAARGRFWAGYGQRSTRQAAAEISAFFGRETTALELVSPRFYHLDVCFCALSGGEIFYYPPAFSAASLAKIHEVVAPEDLIEATDEDAARFNVNAIDIDDRLVMASASPDLVARLAERGYRVSQVDLLPFLMSGGGAYCMALRLDNRRPKPARCGVPPNNHSNGAKRFEMNIMLKDLPPATRDSYRALEGQYGASNYNPFDIVLTRGLGVWVWDIDGRRYLDCLSAYSAVNQGHCHPRILAALTEQASRLAITSRAFMNDQLPLFCKELCAATQSHKVLPMNSGAEAVESAIKVARKWGYEVKGVPKDQAEVIVCANNFHGRTLTIVGFSTDATARDGFGPFTPGFRVVPFGDATALEAAITSNTVAFLVEPIQGEAGVIVPPSGYFKSVREICTRHNVILILDEIQTGLGRTGRLLAEEHEGIEADLTLIGKALSGGFYPVSAVLSNDEILGVLKPGEHGSTFGGNPLACAVARAALKVLIEEGMVKNAHAMGARFLAGLRQINSSAVKELRGRGLMIAIELHPQAGGGRRYCDALRLRGVLCKDTHDHTIRVSPPLVITRDEVDWALDQFDAVLRQPAAA